MHYATPEILETRQILPEHLTELQASGIDLLTAAFAGVSSVEHQTAHGLGIRSEADLAGLCFRYWEPINGSFSSRFARVKPKVQVVGKKYLQPVGEKPRLYFVAGTTKAQLQDCSRLVFITEGEKKTLSLHRAAQTLGLQALVIGIGGVWGWRYSLKELKSDGSLGKGKSRAVGDLDLIRWMRRRVYLFFDSDVLANWKVAAAERALASELAGRGAEVFLVRFYEEFP